MGLLKGLAGGFHDAVFSTLYNRSLVYNACWEDPAVDRAALDFSLDDTVLMITSAGCNALDYVLAGAGRIHCVDVNPRQTALLELKLAAIQSLDYEDFYEIFGNGCHSDFLNIYQTHLNKHLSLVSQKFWNKRVHWFNNKPGSSFYYHGLAGTVARMFRAYFNWHPELKQSINLLLECKDLKSQRDIYENRISPLLWSKGVKRTLSSSITLSFLGVPREQHSEVKRQHQEGVAGFIRESVRYISCDIPIHSNYFWHLYIRGRYSKQCCPEYLKEENFLKLKAGLASHIIPHTCSVTQFLSSSKEKINKFILLDHMDWMGHDDQALLIEEWHEIFKNAANGGKVIFRSAHENPWFINKLKIPFEQSFYYLKDLLQFDEPLAQRLQTNDRVHTYPGFFIAKMKNVNA